MVAVVVSPARADTRDDVENARREVEQTQAAADELAARFEEAVALHAQVANEADLARNRIADAEARTAELHVLMQQFAATAYTGGGVSLPGLTWLSTDDVLDIPRRSHVLELATQPQLLTLDEFSALYDDLEQERARFERATDEAERRLADLDRQSARLQAELLDAQRAQISLEQQLAREEDARRVEEERRRQEAERQLVADAQRRAEQQRRTEQARPTVPTAPPTTATVTPSREPAPPPQPPAPGAAIVCPIRGALSFVDSWGAPRSGGRRHQGVDLMSPNGTPNVAVVSGEVRHKEGNLSGLGVYLYGDDGNVYWYFHLSAYEGPPRTVQQGEVIGYVGSTGNADASAPHTHFEYHPGGGPAVNPYPLTRSAC